MRITQDILYKNSLTYLQRGLQRLDKAQIPLLTGKRINAPSDDPFNTVKVLKYHKEQEGLTHFIENIQVINGFQESGVSALQSMSTILAEAKSIAVQGASSALNQDDRKTLATQIEHILEEAVSLANTHFGGRYLFGGTRTSDPPYVYNGTDTVSYHGNMDVNHALISPGSKIATNIPGPEIFQNLDRGSTLFLGNTGAASGTGTDSGRGNDILLVVHDTTTYEAGSGVMPGTDSVSGDTLIGAAGTHTLTLDIGAGTVALDGGDPVVYDPSSTNFLVTNQEGDQVYLDLTGPLASGTWDITATGHLSLDDGVTNVDIDFSPNQVVQDSVTGGVTHVDTTNITRVGEEYLTYSGGFDLFQTLMALRDDLLNTRGLTDTEQIESISSRLTELDDVHEDVLWAMSEFGGRSLRLELTKNRLSEFEVNLAGLTAEIEEADITEAIMELSQAEQAMQLAQSVASKILQATLLSR